MSSVRSDSDDPVRRALIATMKVRNFGVQQRVDAMLAYDELCDRLGVDVGRWALGPAHRMFRELETGPNGTLMREVFLMVCEFVSRNRVTAEDTQPPVSFGNKTQAPWEQEPDLSVLEIPHSPVTVDAKHRSFGKRKKTAKDPHTQLTQPVQRWNDKSNQLLHVSQMGDEGLVIDWHGFVCDEELQDTLDRSLNLARKRFTRHVVLDMTKAVAITEPDQIWLVGWIARLDDCGVRQLVVVRPSTTGACEQLERVMRAVKRYRARLTNVACGLHLVDDRRTATAILSTSDGRKSPLGLKFTR